MNTLIYIHIYICKIWNFQFWVIGIRKKRIHWFEPVGERNVRKPKLLIYQKTLSTKEKEKILSICILAKQIKKKYNLNWSFPKIFVSRKYMSCLLCGFPRWISLLIFKYLKFCATQVSYLHKPLVSRPNSSQIKLAKLKTVELNKGIGVVQTHHKKRATLKWRLENVWNVPFYGFKGLILLKVGRKVEVRLLNIVMVLMDRDFPVICRYFFRR